jgi:hypothetical protein
MNRPAVKAGLIGGVAGLVVNLIGLIPVISCCSLILELLLFVAVGALAANWMLPPRQTGAAAGEGAIAGLITGIITGLIAMVLAPISFAAQGGAQGVLQQLPPESLQAFRDAGMDPSTFLNTGSLLGVGAVCCGLTTVLAVALGALGGLIFAAMRPQQ